MFKYLLPNVYLVKYFTPKSVNRPVYTISMTSILETIMNSDILLINHSLVFNARL